MKAVFKILFRIGLLAALIAFGIWLMPRLEAMHHDVEKSLEKPKERIRLEGVVVTTVDQDGSIETRVTGDAADLDKKFKELEIRPAKVEVFENKQLQSTLTSKVGRKRTPVGQAERFEFEGNVVGRSEDGRQVYGEMIHYFPSVKDIVAEAKSTILTTDTRIQGDWLRANLDLQNGRFRGNVRLQHLPARQPGKPAQKPMTVTGEQADFDLKTRHHHFQGSVHVMQVTLDLKSQALDYYQDTNRLTAVDQVTLKDGDLTLTGQQMEYRLDTRRALVNGSPKVVSIRPKTGQRQELTAREIVASNKESWVKGNGSVRLVTFVKSGGRWQRGAEILGDRVEALEESGRATFFENVRILSGKATARGEHAVYYRDSRRVYLNGDAEATEKSPTGKAVRKVRGEHILHHLDTGKSVVLGGVHGEVQDGQ